MSRSSRSSRPSSTPYARNRLTGSGSGGDAAASAGWLLTVGRPTVRGELLTRLGRVDEARTELLQAVRLCGNEPERTVVERKLADLG